MLQTPPDYRPTEYQQTAPILTIPGNTIGNGEYSNTPEIWMPSVVRTDELDPGDFGIHPDVRIYGCELSDPYIDLLETQRPGRFEEIQGEEHAFATLAQYREQDRLWTRRKGVAYSVDGELVRDKTKKVWGDPETREEFKRFLGQDGEINHAHNAWLSLLPHAKTLAYLSHPFSESQISHAKQPETPTNIDSVLQEWWVSCSDAVGIRSRAGVMKELIAAYSQEQAEGLRTWTSVGSGTAGPVLESAKILGLNPNMTLVDYDTTALDHAESTAARLNFAGQVTKLPANIFDPKELAKLPPTQMIDLMGIFEYIGEEIKSIGVTMTADEFLQANYEILEPGGRIIFGQMRNDRPNSHFTLGVIGWPFIVQRSPKEVMDIVDKAGINPSEVSVYLPDDGVYAVYTIDKPSVGEK